MTHSNGYNCFVNNGGGNRISNGDRNSNNNDCSCGLESMVQNYQPALTYHAPLQTFYSAASNSIVYTQTESYSACCVSSLLPSGSRERLDNFTHAYSRQEANQKPFYGLFTIQSEYHFIPDNFLKPGQNSLFVGKAEEVQEYVEEAFENIFNRPFPSDIKISMLDAENFRKLAPAANTIGLSINRSPLGLLSEIFVLNDSLGRVMLTIGHELGHVLSPTLPNCHDEEAKAYAFSLLWMKVIKEHNIANLSTAIIIERPAENGLHNVSFQFVHNLIVDGKEEGEIYLELMQKEISVSRLAFI